MPRAEHSSCRTREITLVEFMVKHMNSKTDERSMDRLMNALRGETPLLGYLTFYAMDSQPTLEVVFLYPDRVVTVHNTMLPNWEYEPYPNPNVKAIPIDPNTTCHLDVDGDIVVVSFTGSFAGLTVDYPQGNTRLATGPEVETFVRAFNQVRDLRAELAKGSGTVDWARLAFERSYDINESVRNFNRPW